MAASASTGGLRQRTWGGRYGRQRHRRDLDVRIVLVAIDLEEDVADPHGGTLLMSDDDLNLLHGFILDT